MNRASRNLLAGMPATFEELTAAWDERGIDFQRRPIETILHPIVVNPAGIIRRTFDAGRVEITPRPSAVVGTGVGMASPHRRSLIGEPRIAPVCSRWELARLPLPGMSQRTSSWPGVRRVDRRR